MNQIQKLLIISATSALTLGAHAAEHATPQEASLKTVEKAAEGQTKTIELNVKGMM